MSSLVTEKIICPNCNANITVSGAELFVYCTYCGAKIQMRDIVEVRRVNVGESIEKMVADGQTYYKVEEYTLAERKFREIIKQYPEERVGYEELIRTLTGDETVFPLTHEEEVYRLLKQLELLLPEEEKADFEERRCRIREAFEAEHIRVDGTPSDGAWKREEERQATVKAIKIIFGCFLAMSALVFVMLDFSIGGPVGFVLFGGSVCFFYSAWKNKSIL